MKTYRTMRYRTKSVVRDPGRRPLNEDHVKALMASISKLGLRVPINVRAGQKGNPPTLISGAHRLEACMRLGIDEISCVEFDNETDTEAKMAEITENLHRKDLSTGEELGAIAAWESLSQTLEDERKANREVGKADAGVNPPTGGKTNGRPVGTTKGKSARAMAEATGRSETEIRRIQKRAAKLGDLGPQITGTSLDSPGEADALGDLPEEKQQELVTKAKEEAAKPEGERQMISARALAPKRTTHDTRLRTIEGAWATSAAPDRALFIGQLVSTRAILEYLTADQLDFLRSVSVSP